MSTCSALYLIWYMHYWIVLHAFDGYTARYHSKHTAHPLIARTKAVHCRFSDPKEYCLHSYHTTAPTPCNTNPHDQQQPIIISFWETRNAETLVVPIVDRLAMGPNSELFHRVDRPPSPMCPSSCRRIRPDLTTVFCYRCHCHHMLHRDPQTP